METWYQFLTSPRMSLLNLDLFIEKETENISIEDFTLDSSTVSTRFLRPIQFPITRFKDKFNSLKQILAENMSTPEQSQTPVRGRDFVGRGFSEDLPRWPLGKFPA